MRAIRHQVMVIQAYAHQNNSAGTHQKDKSTNTVADVISIR